MQKCANCNREVPDWYSMFVNCCCGNCLEELQGKRAASISYIRELEGVLKFD